jgi:hypothetical protein
MSKGLESPGKSEGNEKAKPFGIDSRHVTSLKGYAYNNPVPAAVNIFVSGLRRSVTRDLFEECAHGTVATVRLHISAARRAIAVSKETFPSR